MNNSRELHPNTEWLIKWWERLAPIVNGTVGHRRDLCQDLARYMGEMGNDDPSNEAITKAKEWETRIMKGERPWNDEKGEEE